MDEEKIKIRVRTWHVFTGWGIGAIPWIIDLTNEDVDEDEISLCIQEQILKDEKTKNKMSYMQ